MLLKGIRNELLKRRNKNLIYPVKYLSNNSCLYGVERGDILGSAKKSERVRLAKSLTERFVEGKCALTEEMQREDVNVIVEYCDMKSETDLKSE